MITKILVKPSFMDSEWPYECEYWSTSYYDAVIVDIWCADNQVPIVICANTFYFKTMEDRMLVMLRWA